MEVSAPGAVQRGEVDGGPAWLLRTRATATLVCLGPDDSLFLPHWGASGGPTARPADYLPSLPGNRRSQTDFRDGQPLAYPVYGSPAFKEPCLVVARNDGARGPRLSFVDDHLTADALDLILRDPVFGLRVTLRFRVLAEHNLVVRSAIVANEGSTPLTLERVLSASVPLPPGAYDAYTLHGQWGREFQLHRRRLLPGKLVLESRRGISSAEAHPWFAVRPHGQQAEEDGPVWFGSLAWSGNWVCVLEVERNDALSVTTGIQSFDFAWTLRPGETFESPELVCGYSEAGLGGASRLLHAYEETVQLPANHRERLRPVLYNSWEATGFDVGAEQQIALARQAADLGVELFVVDDGWFGARDNDRAGLGDWSVNPRKFPRGLRELVDEVHRLGMGFGIWVEPEMVNPDSDLYRAHPDWAYHAEGRSQTLSRNQLVLNFARPEVREAIFRQLQRLLTDHGSVEFLKWDHNRPWTEVGWPEQPEHQREVWVRHVQGVYEVLGRLRAEFPDLMVEACASGGGRADLGILGWTDQVWTSDNTDAADRLLIQYGYSRAHAPRTMVCWVTDVPNQQTGRLAPLDFRFHVAMQGVLGIGGHIAHWSEDERARARSLIADYKAVRPLVQHGRQYWLAPPTASGPCAVQYVSPSADATAVFLYQTHGVLGAGARRVRLQGLLPERRYRRAPDGAESTGAALMASGLPGVFGATPGLDWRSEVQVWRIV